MLWRGGWSWRALRLVLYNGGWHFAAYGLHWLRAASGASVVGVKVDRLGF